MMNDKNTKTVMVLTLALALTTGCTSSPSEEEAVDADSGTNRELQDADQGPDTSTRQDVDDAMSDPDVAMPDLVDGGAALEDVDAPAWTDEDWAHHCSNFFVARDCSGIECNLLLDEDRRLCAAAGCSVVGNARVRWEGEMCHLERNVVACVYLDPNLSGGDGVPWLFVKTPVSAESDVYEFATHLWSVPGWTDCVASTPNAPPECVHCQTLE